MKEGWEYKKLGEVCDIVGGGTPDKKNKNFYGGNIPWATVRDMNVESVKHTEYSITKEGLDKSSSHIIHEGEVIIATRVGLGKVCLLEQDTAINQDLKGIVPKKNDINRKYLFYWFKFEAKNIISNGVGATVKGVKLSFINNLSFPCISLSEQHRIVSYLDAAFAKIDAVAKNAEDALNEAKALFQSALAKMMEPKEGWEERTLLEIGKTQTGTTPSKSNSAFYGDYMPFIRPSEINYDGLGNLNYNSEIKLSKEGSESGRVFKTGSILMVCIGATISKVGYNEQDVSCNQQINVITPYDGFNYKFIYYAMTAPKFKAKVINEGTSSQATLPIINKRKWEQLTLAFPPIDEQINIVDKLEIMNQKICNMSSNLTRTLTECAALKQSILRKTFE